MSGFNYKQDRRAGSLENIDDRIHGQLIFLTNIDIKDQPREEATQDAEATMPSDPEGNNSPLDSTGRNTVKAMDEDAWTVAPSRKDEAN